MTKPLLGFASLVLIASCLNLTSGRGFPPRSIGVNGYPNENYASRYPDFTKEQYLGDYPGRGLVMDYKVGDRFRLRQPMFLAYEVTRIVYLSEPGDVGVPKLSGYRKDPAAYRYGGENNYQVIRLVPAGTVIEIVKIADLDAMISYFVIKGDANWFRSAAFASDKIIEYTAERVVICKSYDKKLFTKL